MELVTVDRKRFRLVLNELDAIAGDELAVPLGQIRGRGRALSPSAAQRLAAYLRDETGSGGMLAEDQLRAGGLHGATAAAIERQARALLTLAGGTR